MPSIEFRLFGKHPAVLLHPAIVRPHIPKLGCGRFRYLDENRRLRASDKTKLRSLRKLHLGQRAFILGNGPSIQSMDLRPLKTEVSIAVNASFRLYPEHGFVAPYTCFSDRVRWTELGETALALSQGSQFFYCDDWEVPTPHTIVRDECRRRVILLDRASIIPTAVLRWNFLASRSGTSMFGALASRNPQLDITNGVCLGNSVVFMAIQLAAYMGCNPIILLGVDMDYSGNKSHFHDDVLWVPAMDYERDAKPWFLRFRDTLNANGIELLNATRGGRVDCLRRVAFESLFA